MDLSKLLLILIDIFFALMLIVLLINIGLVFYSVFISDLPFYILNKDCSDPLNAVGISKILATGIIQLLFVGIIFYLRKGIKGMVRDHFFHLDVAKNLNISGVILGVTSLVTVLLDFGTSLAEGQLMLGLETNILKSEIFMLIIGLFLMLMSRVIREGLVLKSENELTI